jgi:hypothetical protein
MSLALLPGLTAGQMSPRAFMRPVVVTSGMSVFVNHSFLNTLDLLTGLLKMYGLQAGSARACKYPALKLESPFSAPIRWNCTAPDGYCKTNAAIAVEKQSDSVPPWTPRNREPSLSISRTLFSPPFSSAI